MRLVRTTGLVLGLLLALAGPVHAMTAYCTVPSPADNTTQNDNGSGLTITPCASMTSGQLVVVIIDDVNTGNGNSEFTQSVTGGQTWSSGTALDSGSSTSKLYWAVYNGTWSANPKWSSANGFNVAISAVMNVYTPCSGGTISTTADVAEATGTSSSGTITITGQTPTASASVVTIATWLTQSGGSITFSGLTGGWTYRNNGTNQLRNTGVGGLSLSVADLIQSSAAATGNVSNTQSGTNFTHTSIVTFKETGCSTGQAQLLSGPTRRLLGGKVR